MLTAGTEHLAGTDEDRANEAWKVAATAAEQAGLCTTDETTLPYKTKSFRRLGQGPHGIRNGNKRLAGNKGFITRAGAPAEDTPVQEQAYSYIKEAAFAALPSLKENHARDDTVNEVMNNLPANRLWTT
eukprot:3076618-Heterocapsa_arctica.AAC.1